MSARTIRSRIVVLCAFLAVVTVMPSESFGQLDKRKRSLGACQIRLDPGLGLSCGFPSNNFGVSAAAPVFTINSGIGGGRTLGFGSLFGGTVAPRLCAPRSPGYVAPAPVYCDRPSFWYPSSNLGSGGTFYAASRAVNVVPAPDLVPPFAGQPTDFFVSTPGADTRVYGFRSTPTPRSVSARGSKPSSDAPASVLPTSATQTPAAPTKARPDGEMKEIEAALDRGDHRFRAGDYRTARDEYTRALVLAGEDPGVRIPFGLAEFALGRYSDASRAMRLAVSRPPVVDPSSIDLRQAYRKPADFEAQLQSLESFVSRNPFDPDALFLLGFLKACTGNPIGARAVFDKYQALRDADPAVAPFMNGLKSPGG